MNRVWLMLLLSFSFSVDAAKKNLELEALRIEYDNFITDNKYKPFAQSQKAKAKAAIEKLYSQRGRVKEHAVYMARHQLNSAKMMAEIGYLKQQITAEDEKLDQLNIETLKADAAVARWEADKAQLLLSLQAEEVERERREKQKALELVTQKTNEAESTQIELQAAKNYAKAQEKVAELAKQEADLAFEEIDSLRRQLESLAARETVDGLVMTLGDFVFDSASANIKQGAVDNFHKVLEFIDGYPGRSIRIEGHTDSSGSESFNLNLSQKRAEAVKALLAEYGIDPLRIEAIGMGESIPVADNSSEAGKAKNRRVDIIILNN
ncbi:OmpA family protein [Marinicella litoralis]|uniref:Outer membrane protein OmpA-like peptidoglycan-associated protein n=1 Tax=Marinicella litoralis TaxID=644220 RepID=A0A4R6XKF0_9GAMM|nr:OmpA family protein [Marinicella litoralis]TDR18374.1 outer membrane protein OmpA-like peptidoglycan-associated protein [Marinicella litoralis]